VAVLPVVLAMSDADAALLAAWVRAGGVLVAVDWAQTAKYDQDFAPRPNTTASEGSGAEGKTAFCVHIFSTDTSTHLPRQARDRREENSTLKNTPRCGGSAGGSRCAVLQERRKTPLFAPFIYKMHHFTKTGSGQI
jgi:hypothetical protein